MNEQDLKIAEATRISSAQDVEIMERNLVSSGFTDSEISRVAGSMLIKMLTGKKKKQNY